MSVRSRCVLLILAAAIASAGGVASADVLVPGTQGQVVNTLASTPTRLFFGLVEGDRSGPGDGLHAAWWNAEQPDQPLPYGTDGAMRLGRDPSGREASYFEICTGPAATPPCKFYEYVFDTGVRRRMPYGGIGWRGSVADTTRNDNVVIRHPGTTTRTIAKRGLLTAFDGAYLAYNAFPADPSKSRRHVVTRSRISSASGRWRRTITVHVSTGRPPDPYVWSDGVYAINNRWAYWQMNSTGSGADRSWIYKTDFKSSHPVVERVKISPAISGFTFFHGEFLYALKNPDHLPALSGVYRSDPLHWQAVQGGLPVHI